MGHEGVPLLRTKTRLIRGGLPLRCVQFASTADAFFRPTVRERITLDRISRDHEAWLRGVSFTGTAGFSGLRSTFPDVRLNYPFARSGVGAIVTPCIVKSVRMQGEGAKTMMLHTIIASLSCPIDAVPSTCQEREDLVQANFFVQGQ